MLISCCINTFKRPIFLNKLLISLLEQKLPIQIELEIIVVDNDQEELARPIINDWLSKKSLKIKYYTQPVQNISLTRNKAVKEASGELLLFVDDDGIANENWVCNMYNTLKKYNADGVFGSVIPYYEEGIDEWIKKTNFFHRLIQESGEDSKFFRTGNCLVKSSILNLMEEPFDPKLGLTGGEDSDLFKRLKKNGHKFVFCKEAIIYDFVPKNRANLKYLSHRFHRTGISSIEGKIKISNYKFITRIFYLFRSLILISFSFLGFLFCSPIRKWRAFWQIKLASYTGHLAAVFNYRLEGYKLSII